MKRRINKLNLRRETLSNLDLQQAGGGAPIFRLNTAAHSACQVCYPRPVITEHLTWPIELETIQTVAGPGY